MNSAADVRREPNHHAPTPNGDALCGWVAKRRFSQPLLIVVCWRELRCGCPCLACQRWEDSLGHPDLTPDRDGDRLLRTAPGGRLRPPARRDDPSAADLAALPARGHALA